MKRLITKMHGVIVAMLLSSVGLSAWAANTKTTVDQVTTAVTLSGDVDYIINSATPFTGDGVVNITNTEHAVVILGQIRPSKAISSWLKYIQINGEAAKNNTNCQVKLYNMGCIILPYPNGDKFKPLTVYSEKNFGGESCNDFGLENSGGYMNTLTEAKLNNRIRSFKLKRGYMVTFSLKAEGRGYSRCFIAADKDLEMATMPAVLDNSISSYRVFKWYDAGKKQLANYMNKEAMTALGVQSSYDWGQGNSSFLPDFEWVPNHIYEDWPSSATIGSTSQSPHTKNNNEPRNSSDDHPQDLTTILNNWENMMRTGLRLCSPASWDGSDYWNATGFLADFLDEIDARGWRCDIIDLHCYWAEGSFGNIANWTNKYKRPVWISEWCWGASWNNNGAFASGVTEANVRDALQRICTNLNKWDYVERYYYWNGERDPSRLYKNGSLTPAGQYYASMNSGLGYNGKYDYAPKVPTQYDPTNLSVVFDSKTHTASLSWEEKNGEYNAEMAVQRRATKTGSWATIATVALQEEAASYTYEDKEAINGCEYRILVTDGNGKARYTNTAMAASGNFSAGDAVEVDGKTKYLGGNVFLNGSFDMGTLTWANGKGEQLAAPYFQVLPLGGNDGGTFLQAYGTGAQTTEQAISSTFDIEPNADYYFSGAVCNTTTANVRIALLTEGKTPSTKAYLANTSSTWNTQFSTFNSGELDQARVIAASLGGNAQFDQFQLFRLFDTQEEAVADGIAKIRQKAALFLEYNKDYAYLNQDLSQTLAAVTGSDAKALEQLETAVGQAIQAYQLMSPLQSRLLPYAEKLVTLNLYGRAQLEELVNGLKNPQTAAAVVDGYEALQDALGEYLPQSSLDGKISQPRFASASGWTTKCGTYTEGDQRLATQDGITCWNAWWSGLDAGDASKSMAIKQDLTRLSHGLYSLECKASTEHYCLSNQHGYISDGTTTEETSRLTADYLDLTVIPREQRWETLTTAPVYLDDNGSVTLGFTGSKQGAADGLWLPVGTTNGKNDKREGWWCATDFVLKHTPLYRTTVVPEQWSTICLPYALHPSETVKFYEIVGINADYTQLCLSEVEQPEAGVPYVCRSTVADAQFLEYGEGVSKVAGNEKCNLRGFLVTTASAPVGYFSVIDGVFERVSDNSNRPRIGSYHGVLRKFDDNSATGIPVLESWDGATMPINGVTDDDKAANEQKVATGIGLVRVKNGTTDGIYTVDGRNVTSQQPRPGLYIKVVGGRAYKTIVK